MNIKLDILQNFSKFTNLFSHENFNDWFNFFLIFLNKLTIPGSTIDLPYAVIWDMVVRFLFNWFVIGI